MKETSEKDIAPYRGMALSTVRSSWSLGSDSRDEAPHLAPGTLGHLHQSPQGCENSSGEKSKQTLHGPKCNNAAHAMCTSIMPLSGRCLAVSSPRHVLKHRAGRCPATSGPCYTPKHRASQRLMPSCLLAHATHTGIMHVEADARLPLAHATHTGIVPINGQCLA